MTEEFEDKLVEKILKLIDIDKLTDKIAEKAAEIIVQRDYSDSPAPVNPVIPNPINPSNPWSTPTNPNPWISPRPIEPTVVAYGCTPTIFSKVTAKTNNTDCNTINKDDKK